MYLEIGAPLLEASTVTVAEAAGNVASNRHARNFITIHSKLWKRQSSALDTASMVVPYRFHKGGPRHACRQGTPPRRLHAAPARCGVSAGGAILRKTSRTD